MPFSSYVPCHLVSRQIHPSASKQASFMSCIPQTWFPPLIKHRSVLPLMICTITMTKYLVCHPCFPPTLELLARSHDRTIPQAGDEANITVAAEAINQANQPIIYLRVYMLRSVVTYPGHQPTSNRQSIQVGREYQKAQSQGR